MSLTRRCSRTACTRTAIATLTYVYAESTAVLGPLATYAEPHTYDLCGQHAGRLTAPRGWDVVRLSGDYLEPEPDTDDLLALADAVRETRPPSPRSTAAREAMEREAGSGTMEVTRRGHLRVLRDR